MLNTRPIIRSVWLIPRRTASQQSKRKPSANPPSNSSHLTCKAKHLNQAHGVRAPANAKFGTLELASAGWKHHKASGDFFTIHPALTPAGDSVDIGLSDDTAPLSFGTFGLNERIVANLQSKLGASITQCTAVQARALPQLLAGDHTLIAAETGCGKTLAYLVPIVQHILQRKQLEAVGRQDDGVDVVRPLNSPQALVLTPGRELASQIGSVAAQLCDGLDISVSVLLGGRTKQKMLNPELADVDLLIGTMGATSKLVTTGVYRMNLCEHVVLDEADTLLDDSFNPKLAHFLKRFPVSALAGEDHTDMFLTL